MDAGGATGLARSIHRHCQKLAGDSTEKWWPPLNQNSEWTVHLSLALNPSMGGTSSVPK
jgi:hypothetical protein